MAPSVFDKAEVDRQALADQLRYLEVELADHSTTPMTQAQAKLHQEEAESCKVQVIENHKTLRSAAPKGTDMVPHVAEFHRLLKLATRLHSAFHGIHMSFPPPPPPTAPAGSGSTTIQKIKLPALELQKFSGNLQEWVSFRDMFLTAVHNSSLTKVEKLTQLKTLLTGEAARQVRSLVLCESNYDIAWKSLQERYENNRELLFSIILRLLNQSPITKSNAISLRSLIDTTKECVRSLEVLSLPTQHWDAILLVIVCSKLDSTTRKLWERTLPDSSIPPLSKLFEFLEQQARAEAAGDTQGSSAHKQQHTVRAHHVVSAPCKLGCSQAHPLFRCPEFHKLTPHQRQANIQKLKHCHNCLSEGHMSAACPSKSNCKTCNRRHHTLIHLDNGKQYSTNQQQLSNTQPSSSQHSTTTAQTHHASHSSSFRTGVLATARVRLESRTGLHQRRALIDPGSTNSYITERAARAMNLQLRPCHVPLTGISSSSVGTAKYVTTFNFYPHFNMNSVDNTSTTALVVKSITSHIPATQLEKKQWSHLSGLQLADPDFHIPGGIDILLGTDVVWALLDNQKIVGADGTPFAIKSTLGWLVAGPNNNTTPITVFNTTANLDHLIQRFWEQEEVCNNRSFTKEEEDCERHFTSTHKRDVNGRFTVSLPISEKAHNLGSSRQIAVKRFLSLERKFHHQKGLKDADSLRQLQQHWSAYKDFMTEYEELGHMSTIPPEEIETANPTYYIPHHSVIKESSTTTKLRVVFDASASTSNGKSLNDILMVGPTLQSSIWDIMLRFRTYQIVYTADIAKMYRQILVAPEQRDLQRIVWRANPNEPLKDYRLNTVTYGTASAPYLAVKCLQQLAMYERERYPLGSKVALLNFYVDDAASGNDTLEEAISTVRQLTAMCNSGGFELRKWTSNSPALLKIIPEDYHETSQQVSFQEDFCVKTLGVFWNPSLDKYFFKITLPPTKDEGYTKRIILSEISRIYDPLGWLSPMIISCKIFMQELWKYQLNWDDLLPNYLQQKWLELRQQLLELEGIQIPRCVLPADRKKIILVGCCDASTRAISAAVYLCAQINMEFTSHLLASKTKVAPVKHVTLPRLELNGAVLLSELLQSTILSLNLEISEVRAYTDSTIALHWIRGGAVKWKPYTKRRVQAILDNIPEASWYHIPGNSNPADCASRGINSTDLLNHPLWWTGSPVFFSNLTSYYDICDDEKAQIESEIQVTVHHVQTKAVSQIFTKYSSFTKMKRVIAFILRFLNNWCRRHRRAPLQLGCLTVNEINTAHNFILRALQRSCFSSEYELLAQRQELHSSNHLLKLNPFVAADGLIRVGGRLRHAPISYSKKHPVLLPRGHCITSAVIQDIHNETLHAGPTSTLATFQQRYWVTNGRDTIRAILRRCVLCSRHKAKMMSQVMGDLPVHRVTQSPPFCKTGVDYAGPFTIRPMVRSKISIKCWLAIFVCLVTKAIHIEVVSSLSTDCFLAALRRFMSRRGKPTDIFSDCGTNFRGAETTLREFYKLTNQNAIQDAVSTSSINWHFNPPASPHFGGLWEAGVKSIKYHLLRVMGNSTFTYEEMLTLVTQIEGILNSRPIVPASTDPADCEALTPAHFLNGGPITSLPEPDLIDHRENYLKRWQLIQQRQQLFWKRWSAEYLTRLQQRPKWMKKTPELQTGHLVLIKDERLPPLKWKLGRVIEVHPGKDGHVRVATLKTAEGDLKRPVVKLSLLPIIYE